MRVTMNLSRTLVALIVGTIGVACSSSSEDGQSAPLATCDGGSCPTRPDAARAPAKACTSDEQLVQEKGDCKKTICDASGTIVTVNDDTDVPAADACSDVVCAAGEKVLKAKAAGTACATGKCDGKGACMADLGKTCTDDSMCGSGFCTDGVCCDTACRGECKVCNLPSKEGVCSDVPYYQADASYERDGMEFSCDIPISGARCNGAGKCLKLSTITCNQGSQCMSNVCVNYKCLGAPGELCNTGSGCVSGTCAGGACK